MKADEIIREIMKPGKVLVNVLIKDDVTYMVVEKKDLLDWLKKRRDLDDCGLTANWFEGTLYLDND